MVAPASRDCHRELRAPLAKRPALLHAARMPLRLLALVAALAFCGCNASPPQPSPAPAPAETRDGRWRQDLQYLATELPRLHGNAFHTLDRGAFAAAVARLDEQIPGLSDDAIAVGMAKIVASIDDAHTYLGFMRQRYPLGFWSFADGVFVTTADEAHRDLLRGRVLTIGGKPVADVIAEVATLVAAEGSESRRIAGVVQLLSFAETLRGLGIVAPGADASFAIECEDGTRRDVALQPVPAGTTVRLVTGVQHPPKHRERTKEHYWFEPWPEKNVLYAQYNRCAEDPKYPFATFASDLLAAWDRLSPARLILDLRANGGGNSAVLRPLLDGIRARPSLNARGKLFVLSGRATFSSASLNLRELADTTEALVVGLPPGGNPYSPFREAMSFRLPNCGLTVGCTWKYFAMPAGQARMLEPDLRVESTARDFFAGVDAEVEAAIAWR
jgi:hypothetical protein